MKRKVLVIPFVFRLGQHTKPRFLVAKDRKSGDWTFLSGTCEPYEAPIRCALRELYEETRGCLRLHRLPRGTFHARMYEDDNTKRIDVYFIPLQEERKSPYDMESLLRSFTKRTGTFPPEFFENERIAFQTMAQFRRRRNVWSYIRRIMNRAAFDRAVKQLSLP